ELRREDDLGAIDSGVAHAGPHRRLVLVVERGIDEPVARAQGGRHGGGALERVQPVCPQPDGRQDQPGECSLRHARVSLSSQPLARSAAMRSEAFSPIIIVVMLGFTVTISGMTEASATRSPVTPLTRSCGSSGDMSSSTGPIRT